MNCQNRKSYSEGKRILFAYVVKCFAVIFFYEIGSIKIRQPMENINKMSNFEGHIKSYLK